jgi:hypothetical protein
MSTNENEMGEKHRSYAVEIYTYKEAQKSERQKWIDALNGLHEYKTTDGILVMKMLNCQAI